MALKRSELASINEWICDLKLFWSSADDSDRQSLRLIAPLPARVRGAKPLARFYKQVVKWASPFLTPTFNLPGEFKCWIQILNYQLPSPVSPKTKIPCCAKFIRSFADSKTPNHPWEQCRRRFPEEACLFRTGGFDPDSRILQRAPPLLRLKGYWRKFRGYGDVEDTDLGFLLWERNYWISARAVEFFLDTGYEFSQKIPRCLRPRRGKSS
ncbi:hypothetical protein GQ600_17825 [Phytophthora cactorum]|nr:hypothetical protein GQ600_17825 [Phytophthora cactorum]